MNDKILCVDDDANILAGFQRSLRKEHALDVALGGTAGLAMMRENGPYAVVVADMQMPGMTGIQFLQEAEQLAPDTVRLMLTGNADQKTAMDAVNQGHVFRFLTKPCPAAELANALKAGLKQHRLITAERELLEKTLNGAIATLTSILAMMDPVSFGVGEKLCAHMRHYVRFAKVPEGWALELAAMLSQIGYVSIPVKVLVKARSGGSLSAEERDMLARVARTGSELLANVPRLETVAKIVLYQDKAFGGTGFPADGVAGLAIPFGARVLKVLRDLLEVEMKGNSRSEAVAQLRSGVAIYDPEVLDSIVACLEAEPLEGANAVERPCDAELNELSSGQLLKQNVETKEGTLIAVAGTLISPILIEKLRNFDQLVGLKRPIVVLKRVRLVPV